MCLNCGNGKRTYACVHCRKAMYCSEQCGLNHWFAAHKSQCIGKESFQEKRMEMFEQMVQKLTHVPEPSETERISMARRAMEMHEDDMYVAAAAYNTMDDNRRELYRHRVMMNFVDEYFAARNVPQAAVDVLKEELRKASEMMASAGFEMAEGRVPDMAAMTSHAQKATDLATSLLNRPTASSEKEEEEHFDDDYINFVASYAVDFTLGQAPSSVFASKDFLTRAFGLTPDARLDGTEEEIQQRIDRGVLPKPSWWDTRYAYFQKSPFSPSRVGAGGSKTKGEEEEEEDVDLDKLEGDALNGDLPANAEARRGCAKILWSRLCYYTDKVLGFPSRAIVRGVNHVIKQGGVVSDGFELIIRYSAVLLLMLEGTKVFMNFVEADLRFLEEYVKNFWALDDKFKNVTATATRVETLGKFQGELLDRLNSIMQPPGANATVVHVLPITRLLQSYRPKNPSMCLIEEVAEATVHNHGLNAAIAYTEFRLKSEILAPRLPEEAMAMLRRIHRELTHPHISTYWQAESFTQFAELILSGVISVDTSGALIMPGALELTEDMLRFLKKEKQMIEVALRLAKEAKEAGAMFQMMKQQLPRVQQLAEHGARSTSIWKRIMDARPDLDYRVKALMYPFLGFLTFTNTFWYDATVTTELGKRFLETVGVNTTFFDVFLHDPHIVSRFGVFLTCNAWTFTWLVTVLGYAEYFGEDILSRWLSEYDEMMHEETTGDVRRTTRRQKQAADDRRDRLANGFCTTVARFLRWAGVGGLRATRNVLSFGLFTGLGIVYSRYVWQTGRLLPKLFAGSVGGGGGGPAVGHGMADFITALIDQGGPQWFIFKSVGVLQNVLTTSVSAWFSVQGLRQWIAPTIQEIPVFGQRTYKNFRDKVLYDPEQKSLAARAARAQGYATGGQILFLIVGIMLYGLLQGFAIGIAKWNWGIKAKLISSQPHWTTYKTRRDRRK